MTGAALAERLVDRGLGADAADTKRALFDLVLDAFATLPRSNRTPQYVWWVPGRLEVFGKHTDYAGGRTLVCAVPRGFAVAAAPRGDGRVHVFDARRAESVTLDPASESVFRGWRTYVQVVARRLARNFPGAALGADIVLGSDLPRASGMSSSSALVVGVAAALARVANLEARPEWLANIRTRLDAAGYYACLENGLTFGTLTGDAGVGTHGGSEDHAAIVTAAAGWLSGFVYVPMRPFDAVRLPGDWQFVLAVSGVAAEKTGTAQEPYNRLARGARVLLDLWTQAKSPAASLAAALSSSDAAPARLRDVVDGSRVEGWPPELLRNRLEHFIREDRRVVEAVSAFRESSTRRLAELADASQQDAESLLGNQVPETMALARAAREHGAFAASSFGAGFGGSVWALVDRAAAPRFAERWHGSAFLAPPAPSLTELWSG